MPFSRAVFVLSVLTIAIPLLAEPVKVNPTPTDPGAELLFHASFDRDRRADFAAGADLPFLADYARAARTEKGGKLVPGVFGAAITGTERGGMGRYHALANFNPERGTIAFFVRETEQTYGFEPLIVHSVEGYYWGIFLRLCNKDNALSAWFANEVYKPVVLGTPSTARLKEGQWHHIAVTWDQALGSRYYFDGQEVASNWGKASWFSRGLDPSAIALVHSNNIAYDELYVFDRPLTAAQIARLRAENKPPAATELPRLDFGDAWARNRRQELSWTVADANMPTLKLGATADVRQVVPLQARSVKKESNTVFDGKPGSGWPPTYNYEFNKGNGLHVELPEPFDYMVTEGYFTGQIYDQRALTEDAQKPWLRTEAKAYATRHRLPQSRPAGWISFFKAVMEDKGDLPDKELVTTSRICELNFFQFGKAHLDGAGRKVFYLGPADAGIGKQALGAEFMGRFGPGDRAALRLTAALPTESAAQAIAGLRYHHLLVPPQDADVPLCGLRLRWWLRRNFNGNNLLVSLRDPTFPGRRLLNVDFKLQSAGDERQLLDVRLDLADRLVPAGRPLWLTFCFEKDTELLWQPGEDSSRLELLTGRKDEVMPEYLRTEQAFMLRRFRDLSEARPWGAHKEPEKEMLEFSLDARELFIPLTQLYREQPNDPRLRALWIWTHKFHEDRSPIEPQPVPGCEDAPRWALLQRELFNRCLAVPHWWIENRQTPNGEFGDAWGDDTDLIQNFAKLALIRDPDQRLRRAVQLVADGVYSHGRIKRGINALTMDTLHAYEEGVNAQPVMALIAYGHPLYLERLMEAAKTVEEHLMGINEHGRRRFRSWMFGADEVRTKGQYGADHPGNALFCHPALFLGFYSRQPRAVKFLREWIDGWLALYARDAAAGKKEFPSRTLFDDTKVIGRDYKVRGYGYICLFPALHRLTGEPKYADAWRLWEGPKFPQRGVGGLLPALEIADRQKTRDEVLAWSREAQLQYPGADDMGAEARQRMLEWELTGDEKPVYEALEACVRKMRLTFEAHTWGEPIDDRIWLPDHPLVVMMEGDMSHERNQVFPRHYVSYEGFTDFAAWVREKSDDHLLLWLYNFAPKPEDGKLRVWRAPFGQFRVAVGPEADGDGQPDAGSKTSTLALHRFAAIPVQLPPRQVFVVRLDLVVRSKEDFFARADLAISAEDVVRENGALKVTVHNVGNRAAENFQVAILSPDGRKLASQPVARLDAPLDLVPRCAELRFTDLPSSALTLVLDAENAIPEINEDNNRAVVKTSAR